MSTEEKPSPLRLAPARKKLKFSDDDKCVICGETSCGLTEGTSLGVNSVLNAAQDRKDETYMRIIKTQTDIDHPQEMSFSYHRSCFKKYTSKRNIKFSHIEDITDDFLLDTNTPIASTSTRSSKLLQGDSCLICGFKKHNGDKALHVIQSFERCEDLLVAATKLADYDVLGRIQGDLIAKGGLYHETCMKRYLRRSKSAKTDSEIPDSSSIYDASFLQLVDEIEHELFIEGRALAMSKLTSRFSELVNEHSADVKSYKGDRLKSRLCTFYGNRISVHRLAGKGSPNIILSSNISLANAIHAAQRLKEELQISKGADEEESILTDCLSDDDFIKNTLRNAVSILKHDIRQVKSRDDFPSSSGVCQTASEELVPENLLKVILWLLDKDSFESNNDQYMFPDDIKRKAVAIAECILYSCTNITTPFHLGLAVQLHHDFGSRSLIDTLHAYGLCVSYSELRMFMTSLAQNEINKINSGIYKPSGILSVQDGGCLIQEGDDNIDINCETLDGKNTFHSMARVVFQMGTQESKNSNNIPRCDNRSLVLDEKVHKLMQVLPFRKPSHRPEPPRHTEALKKIDMDTTKMTHTKDLTWVLLRMIHRELLPIGYCHTDSQLIPVWTAYHRQKSAMCEHYTRVGYAPMVDAKPADMATVYTTMVKCKEMTEALGQRYAIQTMDQQLYAVAQQVKWSRPEEFENHILRLGGFHTVQCFTAAIGKLWGDAGLLDLLVDSGVYASSTAESMLSGKQYHRAIRGLTMTYEVLMQAFISQFLNWYDVSDTRSEIPSELWKTLTDEHNHFVDQSQNDSDTKHLEDTIGLLLEPLLEQFRKWGKEQSPTFTYWITYLDAIQILLANIRAEREGDWQMHLATQRAMLPFLFAANRMNYARYLPVYLLDMISMPDVVRDEFMKGHHVYREKQGRFNGLWSDMGVEKTVIRDSKSEGGVVGLTRKAASLLRWTLTRHIMGDYTSVMSDRSSSLPSAEVISGEETASRSSSRDEHDVVSMHSYLVNNMTNPFDADHHPDVLINISTGVHASKDVEHSLVNIEQIGNRLMNAFVKSTLADDGSRSFYSPISQSKLKTFSDQNKATRIIQPDGTMKLAKINPEMVFRRALNLAECREDVNLESVMSHPIGPVPTSLFNTDGTMRKTAKSDLSHKLEAEIQSVESDLPAYDKAHTVYIRDGMAIIQAMKPNIGETFDTLGNAYIEQLRRGFSKADTLVDVFDRYDKPDSTKSAERYRRETKHESQKQYQVIGGRVLPPWTKFLNVAANKMSLTDFLCSRIESAMSTTILQDQSVFIAGGYKDGETTKVVTSLGCEDVESLGSTQEEADTRMMLHAAYSNTTFKMNGIKGRLVIKSPDTDVLILCIYYFPQLTNVDELWIEMGTASTNVDRRRFVPVHEICRSLQPDLCNALPAIHALTGCDSTSSMYRIGKKSVYNLVKSQPDAYLDLRCMGGSDKLKAITAARVLVACLYDPKGHMKSVHGNLNCMRAKMCMRKDIDLSRLPPCEASFEQHVKRAMWQTRIWINSHKAKPDLGRPVDFGWTKLGESTRSTIIPVYHEGQTTSEVLDGLVCHCHIRACSAQCTCRQHNMTCIELCACKAEGRCTNISS